MEIKRPNRSSLSLLKNALRHLWRANHYTLKMIIVMLWGTVEVVAFFVKQKFFHNALPNYDIVDEDRLHRGGQPSEAGVGELKEKGIKTVINLRTDCDKSWVARHSKGTLQNVHIPFNPYRPNEKIILDFLEVVSNEKNLPIYIHCFHGADRTGTLCAIYRIIIQGWDKEKAIEEMKQYGFHWWHYNLIQYIEMLDVEDLKQKHEERKKVI